MGSRGGQTRAARRLTERTEHPGSELKWMDMAADID
jgi:hypothetical protein